MNLGGCGLETNIACRGKKSHLFHQKHDQNKTKRIQSAEENLLACSNDVSILAVAHRQAALHIFIFSSAERDSLFVPLSSTLMCQNSCCSWPLNGRDDAPNVRKTDTEERIIPPGFGIDTQTSRKASYNHA